MPRMLLTQEVVECLPLPTTNTQLEYWDRTFPGFGIRVCKGGRKTWVLKNKNRRVTIGQFPSLSFAEARRQAFRRLTSPIPVKPTKKSPPMTFRDPSWHALPMTAMAPQGSNNTTNAQRSRHQRMRVGYEVKWKVPELADIIHHSMGMDDAERQLREIVRQAVNHAVVSGNADIRIHITRAKALAKEIR